MRLLFLVRQHPSGPDVEACLKNTLLANLLSSPLRPFTILTDLVDDWRFYWVQRSGVWAYKATSRCPQLLRQYPSGRSHQFNQLSFGLTCRQELVHSDAWGLGPGRVPEALGSS